MQKANKKRIYITEVSPRDGFQMETKFIPTSQKVAYINRLSSTGLTKIEVTAFSAPTAVPALADAETVLSVITRAPCVEYTALVPNQRGCERALSSTLDEINIVMSASESHNRANLRMNCEQSLEQFGAISRRVGGHIKVNASLSTAFGCPFEGHVAAARIFQITQRFVDMGVERITLCDTTGVANPSQVEQLFSDVKTRWPGLQFTAHFHNTRGMGLANVLAALESGVDRFDASLGGLGGCPFAPGATGNVCTEDLVHMMQAMGYDTGVDLDALLSVAMELPKLVDHEVPGQVAKAGPYTLQYPKPIPSDGASTQARLADTASPCCLVNTR